VENQLAYKGTLNAIVTFVIIKMAVPPLKTKCGINMTISTIFAPEFF
jgi:hypothetical protein